MSRAVEAALNAFAVTFAGAGLPAGDLKAFQDHETANVATPHDAGPYVRRLARK